MSSSQIWQQNSAGIEGIAEEFDFFGFSLAAGDFNGDRADDLALGANGEDVGDLEDTGAVNIIYGATSGLTATNNQIWHQDSPDIADVAEDSDSLGFSLTTGDFNNDDKDDLAIGVIGESIDDILDSGAVNVIYGSDTGLTAIDNQIWQQNSPGVASEAEDGDKLGQGLTAGDFNGDDKDDLAIGVPGEDIDDILDAGAVNVIYGSDIGLTARDNQIWQQNSPDIAGKAEDNDALGKSLTAGDFNGDGKDDLAIGVPGEDLGEILDAGAVNVIYGSDTGLTSTNNQVWHQNSIETETIVSAEDDDALGESLATGDFNGDGKDDLAIGVPGEDLGEILDAGAVNIIYGSDTGLTSTNNQIWHQNSPGIAGIAENLDNFGSTLAVGDFNNDGKDDLAIASVFENIDDIELAGAVNVIYGSDTGLTSINNQIWHQNSPNVAGEAEDFDIFGSSMSVGDFNQDGIEDLAISSPFDSVDNIKGAGITHILYGSDTGLTA
ncbi:MAG: hypothetical protein Tsb0014_23640 [Pleurocapsa sp.]